MPVSNGGNSHTKDMQRQARTEGLDYVNWT